MPPKKTKPAAAPAETTPNATEAETVTPPRMPQGIAEIRAVYGDIKARINPKTQLWEIVAPPGFESANLVTIQKGELPGLPDRKLYVHKKAKGPLIAALTRWQKVCPEYLIIKIGCFNVRPKRVNGDLSLHSWAIAFDVNADQNPLAHFKGEDGKWRIETDMPPEFVACWKAEGFTWGGDFSRPDAMHFQLASGY